MRFTRILLLVSLIALIAAPVALALRFTDESYNPPVGETGKAYSFQFGGAGGCGPALPYQYRLLAGTLPPGLKLDSSGLVSGTPTSAGDYAFWVELSDQNPPSQSWCRPNAAQREFKIKILQGLRIMQSQPVLQVGIVSQSYSLQFTAEGGGTQTWSVASGALPAGLTLNASTGLLSGTPSQVGDAHFQIKVTDGTRSNVQTYTLPVVEALKITKPATPASEVGQPFTLQLAATGGRAPYTWSAEGLPSGLTLDPATGAISGTPVTPNAGVVKVTVTDALKLTSNVEVSLSVATKLAVVKKALPTLKVGKKAKVRLGATGGVTPRTWTILGGRPGTLPPGIKFSKRTGQFSGTPTKAGTWRFRMQVTDALGVHSSMPIVLKVVA
jgi:hypothetical protein